MAPRADEPAPPSEEASGPLLDLDAVRREQRSAQAVVRRVTGEALVYRAERDRLQARNAENARRLAKQAKKVDQLQKQVSDLKKEISKIRAGRAYRVARLVRQAKSKPRKLITLPIDILKAARRPPKQTTPSGATNRTAAGKPAAPGQATTGGPLVLGSRERRGITPAVLNDALVRSHAAAARLRHHLTGPARPLRIAAIVDDFTRQSLGMECELLNLRPDTWQDEIEAFDPDILFVESAWRGENGAWHNSIPKFPTELQMILGWCREREVATAFWNKEDPVHFQTFLRVAGEFDHVYTTDIDCVRKYREALGHSRVHFFPFACQPRLQNPVEKRARKDAVVFAGGYYQRYHERMRDLRELVDGAGRVLPVEIFDRMMGTTLEAYSFPEEYAPHIVGTLQPEDIEYAYKGYRFALNLNSVKHSQSMFARRAYELLSSGTVTLSNYSRGIRVMLGDLIPMSDAASGAEKQLAQLASSRVAYDRLRLQGLRKVHSEHTYKERLRYLRASLAGETYVPSRATVVILSVVRSVAEAQTVISMVRRQVGVATEVVLFVPGQGSRADYEALDPHSRIVVGMTGAVGDHAGEAEVVAVFDPADWYGDTYLVDLVQAWAYTEAPVVGKASYARWDSGSLTVDRNTVAYSSSANLGPSRAVVRTSAVAEKDVRELLQGGDGAFESLGQFSIDCFDYCRGAAGVPESVLADLRGSDATDTGTPLVDLYSAIDEMSALGDGDSDRTVHSLAVFAAAPPAPDVALREVGTALRITSTLPGDRSTYVWSRERFVPLNVWPDGIARVHVDVDGDARVSVAVRCFDTEGTRIGSLVKPVNANISSALPEGAVAVELGLRIAGPGTSFVRSMSLEAVPMEPLVVPSRRRALVVTDNYPSRDDLYRNGFVHARTRAYKRYGLEVDVFRLREGKALSYHEFEGQEVATGSVEALRRVLSDGSYDVVLVHFLSPAMWQALRDFTATHRIVVWLHGAEVQPWWRRTFNYSSEEQLDAAKASSDVRLTFWRGILDDLPASMHFVFVSQYFADEVMEDLDRRFPESQVSIIHNPIDVSIFDYVPKAVEARKKILSIRPYASAKYANDLSVAAVLELSNKPWFSQLQFLFVGDGVLFDEVLEPLRDFENVTIQRGFLDQGAIARLHKDYGIFLAPTRMDAQGVSKDEAMSSGLVPVTSGVTAIPEFVDESVGYLAPLDDALGMAAAIEEMYERPEEFIRRSRAAAARVRLQTSADVIIPREIGLIVGE